MTSLRLVFLPLICLALLAACKSKKPSLSGEDPVEIGDFIDFFPDIKLPYTLSDTSLLKKEPDSLLINYKVFTQFVPDSILGKVFGKGVKPKIYPLGKTKGDETYLFARALSADKRIAFVLAFDKKDKFIAGSPLLRLDQNAATQQSLVMDKKNTFTRNIVRRNSDGSSSDGKDVFVLNSAAGDFMLIMTDALDDKVTELINPLDTLPRKQKFSADYGSGKMNLVSVRDARRSDRFLFFIHFEKSGGECSGELKGEAIFKSPAVAVYQEAGDPCGLQFSFSGSAVKIEELGGCGSRRGLRCSFDGQYARKKEPKQRKIKR